MDLLYPDAPDEKNNYLRWLVGEQVSRRSKGLVTSPSRAAVEQLIAIAVFTVAVGLGYVYAMATRDLI